MNWIRIRRATADDVDAVAELEKLCFAKPWAHAAFEKDIGENILATYMIAETNTQLIAYAGIWVVIDEGHITNVAVHPDHRGKGVATMLLLSLLDAAREKGAEHYTLEAARDNLPARALYEKLGFRIVAYREKYYENGADAAIMWKHDHPATPDLERA